MLREYWTHISAFNTIPLVYCGAHGYNWRAYQDIPLPWSHFANISFPNTSDPLFFPLVESLIKMESQGLQDKVDALTQALKESEDHQAVIREKFISLSEKYANEKEENARRVEEYEAARYESAERLISLEKLMKRLEGKVGPSTGSTDNSAPSSNHEDHPSPSNVPLLQVPIDCSSVANQVKVQVEHLVRADANLTIGKIKAFSGSFAKPDEVKFDEWLRQVEGVLEDGISEKTRKQAIMNSLRSPALDFVKAVGEVSSREILVQLEAMYDCSSSGVKLLQDFFKMKRDPAESAADYLQRLGVQISKVARKGGVAADHRDETLLTHFISTCDSEQLREVLHVKYESSTPSQHDLLKEVRKTEEVFGLKVPEKTNKMKLHAQSVHRSDELSSLKNQLSMMQARMEKMDTSLTGKAVAACNHCSSHSFLQSVEPARKQTTSFRRQSQLRNRQQSRQYQAGIQRNSPNPQVFCYNCGEKDGHFKQDCKNPPNAALVFKLLKERQAQVDLNWQRLQ